jgi:hypothetical protein
MSRTEADLRKIERLMEQLGREARGPGGIYFTGGVTAVLHGWRASTVDADLSFDPEPPGIFEAIARLKNQLDVNIELASPADFVPELSDWRGQSLFIARHGQVDFFHYDLRAQALAKLERGHERDLKDVRSMFDAKLVDAPTLRAAFASLRPALLRYPAIDESSFADKVEAFLEQRNRHELESLNHESEQENLD